MTNFKAPYFQVYSLLKGTYTRGWLFIRQVLIKVKNECILMQKYNQFLLHDGIKQYGSTVPQTQSSTVIAHLTQYLSKSPNAKQKLNIITFLEGDLMLDSCIRPTLSPTIYIPLQ